MMLLEILAVGALGLIVGSYLNVVILRLNTGRSTNGRSGCMSCAAQLRWYELLPVISFMALKGRCRTCGSALLQQYWMVELATAVLFGLVVLQGADAWTTCVTLAFVATLVVITAYDMRHTIIPDTMMRLAALFALVVHVPRVMGLPPVMVGAYAGEVILAAVVVAMPLFILWGVSRGAWMGFGDVKLALIFGAFLGMYDGLTALMLGFITGACIGVALIGARKVVSTRALSWLPQHLTIKSEIPFAPFLVLGFLLVLLGDADVLVAIDSLLTVP